MLIVDELVCNALAHGASGHIEVSGRIEDDHVVLSVSNSGRGGNVEAQPLSPEGEAGRGLAIVAALSTTWSVDLSKGTRVTARIRL